MEQNNSSADLNRVLDWLHDNRKRLIGVAAVIVVAGGAAGLWIWNKNHHELVASEALSNIRPPTSEQRPTAADAEPFIKVADQYSDTSAGARARLIAGGRLFDAGGYKEAQTQFEKFLQEHPDYPLANEALLGIASSLDAQGKATEAIARYDELINHHTADTTTPQAQVALARLYVMDKKPEQAMIYYEKVLKSGMNDSWTEEAMMQYSELLEKNPGLKKPVPAPVLAPTMAPPTNPAPNTTTSTPAAPVLSLPITNAPKK